MEVYEFDKCLLDRLSECMNVLSWNNDKIVASQVKTEWSYFIELQIEPTGWQAIWKIPRVICEELHVRFPTVVFGMVEQVQFKALKAIFVVEAVQDEDIHVPERHEVALFDLWPTIKQENTELNMQKTADCLDSLRFFYSNVWMPWDIDNDDDLNWVEKHLARRIHFYYALRKRIIKPALAAHIRTLLAEAKYIQQRREYLEIDLSSSDEDLNVTGKPEITDLMRLHLRLAIIQKEIEMLENPDMRCVYEVKFDNEKRLKDVINAENCNASQTISYLVMAPCTLEEHIKLLQAAQQLIPSNNLVQLFPFLQDVVTLCKASDSIVLSPGKHTIKFLEYLNDGGSIGGLIDNTAMGDYVDLKQNAIITSPDDESILLVFDGDFTLNNLVLDCTNVRLGIRIKNGSICLKNCRLIGDGKTSTQEAIMVTGGSKLILDNCYIEKFATGIILRDAASIDIRSSKIIECFIAMDVDSNQVKVNFQATDIIDSKKCGIRINTSLELGDNDNAARSIALKDLTELNNLVEFCELWTGECNFDDCEKNIYIVNQVKSLVSEKARKLINDDHEDVQPVEKVTAVKEVLEENNGCDDDVDVQSMEKATALEDIFKEKNRGA